MACDSQPQEKPPSTNSPTFISLAPHITELLISAGASDHITGVVSYPGEKSDHSINAKIIGDAFKIDYETVLALNPDYVLSWKGGTPLPMIEQLKNLNFNVIDIEIKKLHDIPDSITLIAHLAGTKKHAALTVEKFQKRLQNIKKMKKTPKSAFIQTYHQPLYTVSGQHWMSEAAQLCGYNNIFADLSIPSASVNIEAVISANPEAIIMMSDEHINQWKKYPKMSAVASNNIIHIPANQFSRPSMSLLNGIEKLCRYE